MVLSMMAEGSPVEWDDILGLEQPKEVFRQTVILPALMPDYFTVSAVRCSFRLPL